MKTTDVATRFLASEYLNISSGYDTSVKIKDKNAQS